VYTSGDRAWALTRRAQLLSSFVVRPNLSILAGSLRLYLNCLLVRFLVTLVVSL